MFFTITWHLKTLFKQSMLGGSSASRALGMMHNLSILSLIMKMHPNVMENYYTESFKSKNGEIEIWKAG